MKQALTIAGSDSGGGAGVQADLKTFHAHGVFGASVITAVTAQNTREVVSVHDLPPAIVNDQLDAVFADLDIAAAKTGMLSTSVTIQTVVANLSTRGFRALVVDPVMVSKSGFRLLAEDAVTALRTLLLPMAQVVTPNLHEAALLVGFPVESIDDMKRAAERIAAMGPRAVVVKGGHAAFAPAVDVLLVDGNLHELRPQGKVDAKSVHGTGCTFSAAITARLALGESVEEAVRRAKRYVTRAIRCAPPIGHGHAPGHHFYFIDSEDWDVEC